MSRIVFLVAATLGAAPVWAADPLPKPTVSGLKHPGAVAVALDGRTYITEAGESRKDGDGGVLVVDKSGKAVPFATGLDDPRGVVHWQKWLFVADKQRVWRIDEKGNATVFAATTAFPVEPASLGGIAVDERGMLYVTDAGTAKGDGGAVYRLDPRGKVTVVADTRRTPALKAPAGVVMDGMSHLLLIDSATGELLRVRVSDGRSAKVAEGFAGGTGLTWDWTGRLFVSGGKPGKVWGIARPGEPPVELASGFESAADLCATPDGKSLLVLNRGPGTLTAVPATIPGGEVDTTPLPLLLAPAFAEVKWAGWEGSSDKGKPVQFRPLSLTHAGDGSNRIFLATQQGVLHVFPNDPKAQKSKVFLDIQAKVRYEDKENEQGLLGVAFHPDYKKNGEFFVFYTRRDPKLTNVLSRFRVSKDDPDRADPDSEEELLRITRPYWNHDGGTICFGPDGYLYVAVGDGGAANDPHKNGQNLKTLLGKILRIDVGSKDEGKKYGIPRDNPFVGKADAAPEIWAYGLRNPWRMAFDRKTGRLWASDVGQNLYEEIDLIVKGGNYGWNVREGFHPFGADGVGPRKDLIEPIWEYHHDIGKSVTGGLVYRGKRLPELDGHYLYADYVTGHVWALAYDDAKKRVIANRPLQRTKETILSFGEDEAGEVYLLAPALSGRGIFRLEKPPTKSD